MPHTQQPSQQSSNFSEPSAKTAHTLKSTGIIKRLAKALQYGVQGLQAAWVYEAAFRTELIVSLIAVLLVGISPFSLIQKSLLLGVWVLVLVVELLNSAIETVVDLASPNLHPLAGRAKDLASAAVLLSVLMALVIWGIIATPIWLKQWGY